ncbi:hypothetical protein FA15DRAFT_658012 [Coprinopsis marcescibilis]|uniref:Uncharacterized protein n=1 Tax=Coprinopsis marcescibilis TaxID=230819 RepID=A0A5C3KNE9_COPMA|nr:hypothetical protein FA15DRAFT_658012 [Coprinopsis marcescibilis]
MRVTRMALTHWGMSKAALEKDEMLRGIWQIILPTPEKMARQSPSRFEFLSTNISSREIFLHPSSAYLGGNDIFEGSVNKERFIQFIRGESGTSCQVGIQTKLGQTLSTTSVNCRPVGRHGNSRATSKLIMYCNETKIYSAIAVVGHQGIWVG